MKPEHTYVNKHHSHLLKENWKVQILRHAYETAIIKIKNDLRINVQLTWAD
jgi:hypothetical protein